MKILFLDFDGVLNNESHLRRVRNHDPVGPTAFHREFDPNNIGILNQLCVQVPDLRIVISSSWRTGKSVEWLQNLLESSGFLFADRIVGATPDYHMNKPRGLEIEEWLLNHIVKSSMRITGFVILDDDSDMAHLMSHLVKTSFRKGLTKEHIPAILEVLELEIKLDAAL